MGILKFSDKIAESMINQKLLISLFLLLVSHSAMSAESLCDVLDIKGCASVNKSTRRASAHSVPSVATATQFNPANVSQDRGLGLETFYQPGNSPSFSIVTGTGKMGAGLISSKIENSFFGNRVPELESEFLKRNKDQKQYESNKYSAAIGFAVYKSKMIGLDLGLLFKYNKNVKNINLGPGASLRVGPFSFGYSLIKDDLYLKANGDEINPRLKIAYVDQWGSSIYKESYTTQSIFAGVKFRNLFLDIGQFKSQFKFYDTDKFSTVRLYSASYIHNRFLFNIAQRVEDNPSQKYSGGKLVDKQKQSSFYGGIQFSLNRFIVLGAHYNYYLLEDFSGSLTVFF